MSGVQWYGVCYKWLLIYYATVSRMCMRLCSIFLLSDGGKVVLQWEWIVQWFLCNNIIIKLLAGMFLYHYICWYYYLHYFNIYNFYLPSNIVDASCEYCTSVVLINTTSITVVAGSVIVMFHSSTLDLDLRESNK